MCLVEKESAGVGQAFPRLWEKRDLEVVATAIDLWDCGMEKELYFIPPSLLERAGGPPGEAAGTALSNLDPTSDSFQLTFQSRR